MFFKLIILFTLTNITSLLFISYFFTGFKISESYSGYFILLAIFLAFINYFIDPLVKFFTLKTRFITIWLFGFLITMPILYFAKVLVAGIEIKSGVFKSITFGILQFTSFNMSDIAVIIASALVIGFGFALARWIIE